MITFGQALQKGYDLQARFAAEAVERKAAEAAKAAIAAAQVHPQAITDRLSPQPAPAEPTSLAPADAEPAETPITMLEHALSAAKRGIRVFPLKPGGKTPAKTGWQGLATTDEARIRLWWEENPNFNIGGVVGLAIDADVKEGAPGLQDLETFNALGLTLKTYTQATPTGGRHLLYATDADVPNSAKRVAPGLDIRGRHGYVALAGSRVAAGEYVVLDDLPIIEAPADLVALCGRKKERAPGSGDGVFEDLPADVARAVEWLRAEAEPAVEGSGNDMTYRVACGVRRFGISESRCVELMLQHWNERCAPPWDPDDLIGIVGNAYTYAQDPAGVDSVAGQFGEFDADPEETSPDALPPQDRPWPEPEDLWADTQPPPRLLAGIFPEPLDSWARDAAYRLGDYDPGCIAMPALVALSGIVPASLQVQVKQHDTSHRERPILWGMLHGSPGAKKSPAIGIACEPLCQIQAQLDRENARQRAEFDQRLARWRKPGRKGAQAETEKAPATPKCQFVVVNDATVEALAPVLAGNPGGLACVRDELSGWIGGFDAYRQKGAGSKDREFWLGAKQGQPYSVLRVSRETVHVPSVAVSMLGGMQPEVLRQHYAGLGSDGILQRFLIVHIERSAEDIDQAPDLTAKAAIFAAAENLRSLRSLSDFLDTFRFAPAADFVRKKLQSELDQWRAGSDLPEGFQQWLSKLEGEWARVALLFHLVEWAAGDGARDFPVEPPSSMLEERTARAAARFLLEYALPHRLYVERSAEGCRGEGSDAVWIAGHILVGKHDKIRERDIYTNYHAVRKLAGPVKQARIRRAMEALCTAGWATPTAGKHPHWDINPAVHERFAQRADLERARRTSIKEKIAAEGEKRAAQRALVAEAD